MPDQVSFGERMDHPTNPLLSLFPAPLRARPSYLQVQASPSEGGDVPQLTINGQPFAAAISSQNESDLYRFNIGSPGMYTVETEGSTDVFLTLFGPDDQSNELANDDDSGTGRNSRIQMDLSPGEYFAAVRHYSAFGTGPYSISVSSG